MRTRRNAGAETGQPDDEQDGEDDDRPLEDQLSGMIGDVMSRAAAVEKRVRTCLLNEGLPELYAEAVASDVSEAWANDDPAPIWYMPGYEPPQNDPNLAVGDSSLAACIRAWQEKWADDQRRNPPRRWRLLGVRRSSRPGKKLVATFEDRDTGATRATHFGATGYEDFTTHRDPRRKERYLERHGRGREDWNDPTTPGALSRWLLWNKPTLEASLRDFKRRFGL